MLKNIMRSETSSAQHGGTEEGGEIDIMALAGALWRGKFIIAAFALATLLAGAYYAYEVAVPTYRAQASLALELRTEPVVDIQAVVTGASTEAAAMNTEIEVIQSRGVLRQLVEELDLTEDPEFNAALRPEPRFTIGGLVGSLRALVSEDGEARSASVAEDEAVVNRTISALRGAISASVQRNTYIFNIYVTTWSPRKSQLIANTLAEIYIADQINQKFSATENVVTWLSERVVDLEEELRVRENELKSLRTEIDVVSIEGVDALNRQLIDARDRAATADANVATTEARLSRIAELREAGDYARLAEFLDDPTLADLVERNAEAPTIQARVDTLTRRVESNLVRQRQQAEALENSVIRLEGQVAEQSEDLVQLQQVEREMQATRTLYETFLTRLKEATVQRGLAQADSRILSAAIPGSYVSPRKSSIMMMSLFLGLLVGSAIVLARQFLNKGYRNADELESSTSRPIFGQIPIMPIKRRDQLVSYLKDKPASASAEAIRNLRTSILLSSSSGAPQVIMSTSSLPGEGKTTQSISLAHNLSGLKKRVLLIEGDVRRRTLDEYFRTEATPSGGIVAAISGDTTIEDIQRFVLRDPRLDMDIILGEKSRQNAADLFASDKFISFLDTLRGHYDHIVIDTPPVLVVPDARVIGQHVDAIIFNVAWDRTSRVQVKEALRQFSTVNLDVDGLVLSQIDPAGMKRYGYGGKYGSYAAYGSAYYDS